VTHLLDISTLVALLLADHEFNEKVTAWSQGKSLAVCPLTELGFLRVAMSTYNATPDQARKTLADFWESKQPKFVPADISALTGEPFPSLNKSTDWYIANLASQHGMKWATTDTKAKHPAAEVI